MVDLPVAPGDTVQADDVIVVLETDKVSVDVRAPEAGALVEILAEVDDVVAVGAPLFRIDTDVKVAAKPAASAPTAAPEPAAAAKEQPAAPVAATTAATPPPPAAAPAKKPSPPPKPLGPPIPEAPAFIGARTERRTKMSRMRQRVAARLKDAQNTAAMLTTFQECDMGNFMEVRNRHKDEFEKKHGVKL